MGESNANRGSTPSQLPRAGQQSNKETPGKGSASGDQAGDLQPGVGGHVGGGPALGLDEIERQRQALPVPEVPEPDGASTTHLFVPGLSGAYGEVMFDNNGYTTTGVPEALAGEILGRFPAGKRVSQEERDEKAEKIKVKK